MEPDEIQIPQRLPVAERINAGLIRESAEALAKLRDRTGLSKTDTVNRAIALYEFIDAEMRKGNEIIIRDLEGRDQRVKLVP